jgi:hypothetical protein
VSEKAWSRRPKRIVISRSAASKPAKDLAYLLDRMGIAIPRRLKIAPGLAPNVVPT